MNLDLSDEEARELKKSVGSLVKRIDWVLMNRDPKNKDKLAERLDTLKSIAEKLGVVE